MNGIQGLWSRPGLLVAVGRRGLILRSEDDGVTWQKPAPVVGPDLRRVHGRGDRVVAVGSNGAVAVSTDAARTWHNAKTGLTADLRAVAVGPEDVVVAGLGGQVAVSADGTQWERADVGGGTYEDAQVYEDGRVALLSLSSHLYTRQANGSWVAEQQPVKYLRCISHPLMGGSKGAVMLGGAEDTGAECAFYDCWYAGEVGLAVGLDQIAVRRSGKWVAQPLDGCQLAAHGVGKALWVAGNKGVHRSLDGGGTWEPVTIEITEELAGAPAAKGSWSLVSKPPINANNFAASSSGVYAVGHGGMAISRDGGVTWTTAFDGRFISDVHADGDHVWAAPNGEILHSTDAGATWTAEKKAKRKYFRAFASADGFVYVTIEGGTSMLRNEIGKKRWAKLKMPKKSARGLWAGGPEVWVVGRNGLVAKSADRGDDLVLVSSPGGKEHWWSVWSNGAGATFIVSETGTSYRTLDGGDTWTKLTRDGRRDLYARAVWGVDGVVFAGEDSGIIYRTEDLGDSWERVFEGPKGIRSFTGAGLDDIWACSWDGGLAHKT